MLTYQLISTPGPRPLQHLPLPPVAAPRTEHVRNSRGTLLPPSDCDGLGPVVGDLLGSRRSQWIRPQKCWCCAGESMKPKTGAVVLESAYLNHAWHSFTFPSSCAAASSACCRATSVSCNIRCSTASVHQSPCASSSRGAQTQTNRAGASTRRSALRCAHWPAVTALSLPRHFKAACILCGRPLGCSEGGRKGGHVHRDTHTLRSASSSGIIFTLSGHGRSPALLFTAQGSQRAIAMFLLLKFESLESIY